MDVCRAITFINYHIPMGLITGQETEYTTLGYFDGMMTEKLSFSYQDKELKPLWHYSLKKTAESEGKYSFQNIFCFSRDDWNNYTDDVFWDKQTNENYPLTFVAFVQLKEYKNGDSQIKKQCQEFNNKIESFIKTGHGIFYTYSTIDKNDFVVCIKCRDYRMAVNAIENLHSVTSTVIYSYTTFSVDNRILNDLKNKNYEYLFRQKVDSICLKGITNSWDSNDVITLNRKYYEFCIKLVNQLYEKEDLKELEKQGIFKIYDILGDNDFRLIARNVNLGVLLYQFAKKGILCYEENDFRYYLYSCNIVLNIISNKKDEIDKEEKLKNYELMIKELETPKCCDLQEEMKQISAIIQDVNFREQGDEKIVTFCAAIWQLIQSLKPLEAAPTKKYDFLSIYHPLSLMISILEEKLYISQTDKAVKAELNKSIEIFDFIHKISMTLHGTLRTDIQFIQIKDFNVIVHYAPAKLRAFYSLWALELSDFYNEFCDIKNEYSFILCSGMFLETSVKQFFVNYEQDKRLMLITVPERHLYSPMCLSVILAHEVSHFVGYSVRKRPIRHEIWIKIITRILFLEWNYFRYISCRNEYKQELEKGLQNTDIQEILERKLFEEEAIIRKKENLYPHEFHSKNSVKIIQKAFLSVAEKYIGKIVSDECGRMNVFLQQESQIKNLPDEEKFNKMSEIRRIAYGQEAQMLMMYTQFQHQIQEFVKAIGYVTTEAYADLNAILTLSLDPKKYILSFFRSELNDGERQIEGNNFVIRIALTIHTIQYAVKRDFFANSSFAQNWSGDVLEKLLVSIPIKSFLFKKICVIKAYCDKKRDCNEKIRDYKSIYNYIVKAFVNKDMDFFNDKIIWEFLCRYMEASADEYVNILEKDDLLKQKREKLTETYNKFVGSTCLDLVQEVENFLYEYEK